MAQCQSQGATNQWVGILGCHSGHVGANHYAVLPHIFGLAPELLCNDEIYQCKHGDDDNLHVNMTSWNTFVEGFLGENGTETDQAFNYKFLLGNLDSEAGSTPGAGTWKWPAWPLMLCAVYMHVINSTVEFSVFDRMMSTLPRLGCLTSPARWIIWVDSRIICGWNLIIGSLMLCASDSLQDLILNAVALCFVKDIDENIVNAFKERFRTADKEFVAIVKASVNFESKLDSLDLDSLTQQFSGVHVSALQLLDHERDPLGFRLPAMSKNESKRTGGFYTGSSLFVVVLLVFPLGLYQLRL